MISRPLLFDTLDVCMPPPSLPWREIPFFAWDIHTTLTPPLSSLVVHQPCPKKFYNCFQAIKKFGRVGFPQIPQSLRSRCDLPALGPVHGDILAMSYIIVEFLVQKNVFPANILYNARVT